MHGECLDYRWLSLTCDGDEDYEKIYLGFSISELRGRNIYLKRSRMR